MTTRHLMGAWSVLVGLACAMVCAAGEHPPARAPVAPVAPEDDLEVGSDLEKAYALERMGRFDEAIAQYLAALVPAAPEQASFEVPLGIARLSEDRAQLEEALMATEMAPLWDPAGFGLARAVLIAKLGYYAEVPGALLEAAEELRMVPEMVPEQFPLLLEALLALSERSPEAGAVALVSAFELTSPHANVWQRGLRRIDQAVAVDTEGLLTLRAVAMIVNDSVGSEETAQKLEELLREALPGPEPEARLVELALDAREAGRELKAELARLTEDGVPLTLADAAPRPVPEAENAAVLYRTVFRARVAEPEADQPGPPEAGLSVEELDSAIGRENGTPMPAATRDLLESPPAQQVLETLRKASLMPHSVFPLKWDEGFAMLLPHLASFRAATRVLAAYSGLLAQEGRTDEALDWCMVALRMSEHASSEPVLVSQLVSIAMRAITVSQMRELLSSAAVPPAVAQRCEEYLRSMDLNRGFRAALVAERAVACDLYQTLRTDPAGAAELLRLLDGGKA
jgi:tetratricopeptide (TPR) repeat protein